jgi:hypothetical protein
MGKKFKKYREQNVKSQLAQPRFPENEKPFSPERFAAIITAIFFLIALFGILHHEMWRDEHQAWLVARDADSFAQIFQNMKYEGNPALWHFLLYWITRITHNPIFMQALHLAIACGFIFTFNRYAPIKNSYKILFTFSYFPLYEYAVISRSYGLGVLLLFVACALYKNRQSLYIILGIILALLSNVSIYSVIIASGISGILILDYFLYQEKNNKRLVGLVTGLSIFAIGVIFSMYQIWPSKDNSFPAAYATEIFDFPRWSYVFSKFTTTYLNIPEINLHFWNTNLFLSEPPKGWNTDLRLFFNENPIYLLGYIIIPITLFLSGIVVFLRKPIILLFYIGANLSILSLFYYSALFHSRYCGHFIIVLVVCYWLAAYYPELKYSNNFSSFFSGIGKKISDPFIKLVLLFNVAGALVAYTYDYQYKFSTSKQAADFIKENKLDTLTIAGITDFTISPIASYLDTKLYYPQMNDFGSFTIWSNKRNDNTTFQELLNSISNLMDQGRSNLLLVKDSAPQLTADGKTYIDLEKAMIKKDLQIDFIKKFDNGIVSDEKYFIYLIKRVDPSKTDLSSYPILY